MKYHLPINVPHPIPVTDRVDRCSCIDTTYATMLNCNFAVRSAVVTASV